MPRTRRSCPAGIVFHCLNRAVGRHRIFQDEGDYAAFERVMGEAQAEVAEVELFSYCLMPNHWHLVVRAAVDDALSEFMQWLTVTHAQRWHAHRHTSGTGHLYQGRFKSFPVETDQHFLTVCRYVERNGARAGLCGRAEDWRWGSAWRRVHGDGGRPAAPADGGTPQAATLAEWPVGMPADWVALLNRPQAREEEEALRTSIRKGRPFGSEQFQAWTAEVLDLGMTFRDRGRPRKKVAEGPSGVENGGREEAEDGESAK